MELAIADDAFLQFQFDLARSSLLLIDDDLCSIKSFVCANRVQLVGILFDIYYM